MLIRVLTAILIVSAQMSAAAVDLKGWVLESSDYPNHKGLLHFFDKLNQTTSGKYQGKVFWRETLGNQKKVLPMFHKGEIDLAIVSNAGLSEALPVMEVMSMPFLFRDTTHMLKVLDGEIGDGLKKSLQARGFIVLAWYNGGSRSFYSRGKAPRNASDFAGMRMRVANRETMISMVKAMGGTPSTLAYEKVVDALTNGEIDAAENDIISYYITEHYKTAPNYVISHHNVLPEALVISAQRWKSLSDDEKAAFQAAADEFTEVMRKFRAQREAEVRAILEKAGVKFFQLRNTENFIARMKTTYEPVLKNQESTDLMFRIMTGASR